MLPAATRVGLRPAHRCGGLGRFLAHVVPHDFAVQPRVRVVRRYVIQQWQIAHIMKGCKSGNRVKARPHIGVRRPCNKRRVDGGAAFRREWVLPRDEFAKHFRSRPGSHESS